MALKLRTIIKFPAIVNTAVGLAFTKINGVYNFFFDFKTLITLLAIPDASTAKVLVYTPDPNPAVNGTYNLASIATLIASGSLNVQNITSGGPQMINPSANIVLVNQAVGAPITLTLPLGENKIGEVLIVDWKGDSDTNPIDIVTSGSETYQAGLTSWRISGQGASISFKPISNVGYAA
jgi:hypothetical protein